MDVHPENGSILSMPPGIPKEFEQGEIEDKPKGKDSPKKMLSHLYPIASSNPWSMDIDIPCISHLSQWTIRYL